MNAPVVKDPNRTHEPSDVRPATLWFVLTGLALLILGSLAASWLAVLSSSERDLTVETTPPLFPAPGVEANQSLTRQQLLRSQREALDSYGWSDREPGIARIPIDRAMQLMTPRHLAGSGPATDGVARPDDRKGVADEPSTAMPVSGVPPHPSEPAIAPKPPQQKELRP